MFQHYTSYIFCLFIMLSLFSACEPQSPTAEPNEILASDDPRIGEAIDTELQDHASTHSDFNILERSVYFKVYNYADSLLLELLNTQRFQHASDFNWTIRIYEQIGEKNAFVLPGGYLYLSKELLLFLENEAEFVGLLAHELAVIDSRVVTERLRSEFSISYLLDIALGGQVEAPETLRNSVMYGVYSKEQAVTADEQCKEIFCPTAYDIRAYAAFVGRAEQNSDISWIRSYPHSGSWSNDIYNSFDVNTCGGERSNPSEYEAVRMMLVR